MTAPTPPDHPDLIVIGSGAAGLSAAVFGALDGARVLLLEHNAVVGGTTAWSAGTCWIPGTRHDTNDAPIDSAHRFLDTAVGNRSPRAMREAFLAHGAAAIARLETETDVQFKARPFHPDYLSELPGSSTAGRAIEPLPFDGRRLGEDLALIRRPIPEFTLFGGMMIDRDDIAALLGIGKSWAATHHAAGLLARYALDRLGHPRGTRLVMGNALIGRLLFTARRLGVTVLAGATVETLHAAASDDGAAGVTYRHAGQSHRADALGGVILATGGFHRHAGYRRQLLPAPLAEYSPAAPGHTGELHEMALSLGARHGEGCDQPVYWAPVSVRRRADGSDAVFPHFVLDRSKPGILSVNHHGRRFVNESRSYHEFVCAMYANNADGSGIPAYLITDARGLARYGLGMIRPGTRRLDRFIDEGYLVRGDTLAALAAALGIPADALADTVARMNHFAANGVDEDFGRGSTVYERANGDATHGPNPTLGTIDTAPFYAIRLYPGDIASAIGLVTDSDARVLDGNDHPIPGLYACGNDMQSIMGGVYTAPGVTIGPAIVFASIAAAHASARAGAAAVASENRTGAGAST